jgi:phosphoesterase RecJ-like protein
MLTIEQQISEQIDKATRILITFKRDWTGDTIASALALKSWLNKKSKAVDIVAEKPTTTLPFSFLPGYALISHELDNIRRFIISLNLTNGAVDQVEYRLEKQTLDFIVSPKEGFFTASDISSRSSGFRYDLIITLGTPDLESLGSIYDRDTEFFFKTAIVNFDNNPANENFGQINSINVKAVAVAEIIYDLISPHKNIDEDMATCLLAGLITATKSFKTPNITPHTLTIASNLITLGGRREEIINSLYRSRQLNVLKLWGRALTGLKESLESKLVWSTIKNSDFQETNTTLSNLTDIIDELIINMPKAEIIVILYEDNNQTKALVYSVRNLNALELTESLKGHGTRQLVNLDINKPLTEGSTILISTLEKKISSLPV